MKPTKIGYLELKQAIAQLEEEIQRYDTINQINAIVVNALVKELKKYPAPNVNKELDNSKKELF